ncbi:MAG: adenylate/guanylate cyclase domain-containing protein [Alphaproteobacteria bacterium]|uniref:Guanylate cyclase domain-containing protein n=1 Tax=viral metagenome TaxID=1070528 RepID=A0A6C0HSA5_9ZZZZ|nr:adenylate/guanylate cyclase domain-containing protein [Alphaproteobacteria bacterium]
MYMLSILCIVVIHYNVDTLFKNLYVPYLISNNYVSSGLTSTISSHSELYFLLNATSYYMLFLYLYTLSYRLFISKINDKNCLGLSFIYIKHIVDVVISPNMTIVEYETSRAVMWAFTTPLMLKMYCDANDIKLIDIKFHYHLISIICGAFLTPLKGQIYYSFSFASCIPLILFIKALYKYRNMPFTNLYIIMWYTFILINAFDFLGIFTPSLTSSFYNIADTLCKFICNIVISNYTEQEQIIRDNMDLQSVNFVSTVIKHIKQFEIENENKITINCSNLVKYCKKKFVDKIPKSNSALKLELLKKILPLNLDIDYMNENSGDSIESNKKFTFICVMFMDIINYTELAKKFDGDIIFKLLDDIYNRFDVIIKKYAHLQKIETIGDAYFVVGDIFRTELNHKIVVKEIIQLGVDFIKEIKNIKSPTGSPLSIRIGINLGPVNVGILGSEVPRLCVVGNAVNVASRLQSTADADTIQMSRHVYEQAQEIDFGFPIEIIEKNNVFLKNIGSTTTYNIFPT